MGKGRVKNLRELTGHSEVQMLIPAGKALVPGTLESCTHEIPQTSTKLV
jgi:hypothetical protein